MTELSLSQKEIDEMDWEKRTFFIGLFEEIDRQQKKAIDKMKRRK